ncbi:MAG: aldehyde dehydrogenase family protein [Thermogemmatispora sp.]|uniref:aldehyde dehydrogenase family protein n=1 Tax=Thermogemmatispora sp. TaxID=1968838 RepID=UPI001E025C70|nr:aldehyde dehydrogenase family protein [Thermogemmatispora sp.]MBX5449562.1 aldehyde dehydrogenase family protein [Thermogemmatispora sp.]
MTIELRSYIGGTWREGIRLSDDLNPAHPSEVVARTSLASAELAAEAVQAARSAFAAWRTTPAPVRGDILRKAADLLEQRAESVGRDLTREEGKTLSEAISETKRAVSILRYYAGQALEPDGETYPSSSRVTFLYARREPVGVVSVITPWNFPIAIPAWKIAPALAYGNTVVWKPAELVPLTAVHFTQALLDAGLPPGVLNLVLGKGSEVGDILVTHPQIDAITFTGSNAVGRALQHKAIEHGKKVQLEMGGKNPAVVLADANLEVAAEQVARGAFLSAGQKCTATSRVIVERAILPEFQERLVALAQSWKLGDPLEPETRVGPLVSEDQLQKVSGYLQLARQEGGRFLAGGEATTINGEGYYVRPSIVTDLDQGSRVAQEEIFGPVAALLPASSFEEAVALANATPFGLSASLFTNNLSLALRFAAEIQAGVVKINQESAGLEFQVPFGGMKESSSGSREQGKAAREFFTQWKTVYIDQLL